MCLLFSLQLLDWMLALHQAESLSASEDVRVLLKGTLRTLAFPL